MNFKLLSIIAIFVFFSASCKKEEEVDKTIAVPVIVSLTSDKSEIESGGEDATIITCEATGENLEYLWEVDLGDITPTNSSASIVEFRGSECCIGEKNITCVVSNAGGKTEKIITIQIVEGRVK